MDLSFFVAADIRALGAQNDKQQDWPCSQQAS